MSFMSLGFTDDKLWEISKYLSEEKYDSLDIILSELTSEITDIKWNPNSIDINIPQISFALSWWNKNCLCNVLPDPSVIKPENLKPVLGKMAIVEPVNNGENFKYRLYGSNILPESYKDLTNKKVTDIWSPLRTYFLINYRAVFFGKKPLFSTHKPHISLDIKNARLILPFGINNEVTRLLIVNIQIDT